MLLDTTTDAAANTDGFDIGDSTGITITGANIYNQDE
jgi:polygalacturonase